MCKLLIDFTRNISQTHYNSKNMNINFPIMKFRSSIFCYMDVVLGY